MKEPKVSEVAARNLSMKAFFINKNAYQCFIQYEFDRHGVKSVEIYKSRSLFKLEIIGGSLVF